MCDACQSRGTNWSLANGPGRSQLEKAKLFSAVEGKEINLKLCYLCSINLFINGERKFLTSNRPLRDALAQQHSHSDFEF